MSWAGPSQWSGTYWGSSGKKRRAAKAKGKGKDGDKDKERKDKPKNQEKERFPAYDTITLDQSGGSSGASSSSDGTAELMQKAMRSLLENNPTLNVPKEVTDALCTFQDPLNKSAKDSLYEQQKRLNLKRKATTKVEKLQQALTRKGLQMQAYKEQMKQKLAEELERFNKEQKEIADALVVAKEQLARIERGEEPEMIAEEMPVDVGGDTLAQLLGIQEVDQQEVEKLKSEKMYAESMAAQLQQQVQYLMTAAVTGASPSAQTLMGAGGRNDSPQLPGLGPQQGQEPGHVFRKSRTDRPAPYLKENTETTKQSNEKNVEFVQDSPDGLARMDG